MTRTYYVHKLVRAEDLAIGDCFLSTEGWQRVLRVFRYGDPVPDVGGKILTHMQQLDDDFVMVERSADYAESNHGGVWAVLKRYELVTVQVPENG